MAVGAPFTGFSRDAIQFLADLTVHNERSWFQPRKAEYEHLLKEPLEALCLTLATRFEAAGLPLRADSRSPFRIYRDVRFSADKSPYKTHVSASFPWTGEGGGVGAYFHFQPGEVFAGGGMWHPEPAQLAAWRHAIDVDLGTVRAVLDAPEFVATFGEISGDRLKRVPTGFAADHPGAELLKLKDVTFGRRLSDDEALSPDLPDTLAATFVAAVPLLGLLARLTPDEARAGWLRGA
ncbi:MAG TPA: DUF2461 domain-containing protein [Candidatus Limnocylindrales bacterium]|jgi:uncharacterized protein (TIGR02453 family)